MNDREREQWVVNDETLYNWYRSSRMTMRMFLRMNRIYIDTYIAQVLGKEPQ